MEGTKDHIIVLGAGIIGLSIALRLLNAGYQVTIIAKTLPPRLGQDVVPEEAAEYASIWAGAHWRTHAKKDDVEQQEWDIETYHAWRELVEQEKQKEAAEVLPEEEKSGIAILPSTITWSSSSHPELTPTGTPTALWWSSRVKGFTTPTPTSARFTALAVNVPRHLAYLHAHILAQPSASIIKADLPLASGLSSTIKDALEIASLTSAGCSTIVNALGLSARRLFATSDPEEATRLHPIRGQTVLVRGELAEVRTLQSYDTASEKTGISYAIPRPGSGTTVLGGCNIANEWSTEVDEKMTAEILEKARTLVPELFASKDAGDKCRFDVIKAQVGLRPGRRGGARVEPELLCLDANEKIVVVHAYGFAGAGFQNSVGVASSVLKLVEGKKNSRERLEGSK